MTAIHEAEEASERPVDDPNRVATVVRVTDLLRGHTLEYGIIGTQDEGDGLLDGVAERSEWQLLEVVPQGKVDKDRLATRSLHRWVQITHSHE